VLLGQFGTLLFDEHSPPAVFLVLQPGILFHDLVDALCFNASLSGVIHTAREIAVSIYRLNK
jgi:hypothetical protein